MDREPYSSHHEWVLNVTAICGMILWGFWVYVALSGGLRAV